MRRGFTLIELLVVITIMVLVIAVVAPQGAKILDSYEKNLKNVENKQELSKERANAFLFCIDKNVSLDKKDYFISKKGMIFE